MRLLSGLRAPLVAPLVCVILAACGGEGPEAPNLVQLPEAPSAPSSSPGANASVAAGPDQEIALPDTRLQ